MTAPEVLELAEPFIVWCCRLALGTGLLCVLYLAFGPKCGRMGKAEQLLAKARGNDRAAVAQSLLCENMLAWLDDEILKESIAPRDDLKNSEWLRSLKAAQKEVILRMLELSRREPGSEVDVQRKIELKGLWDSLQAAK